MAGVDLSGFNGAAQAVGDIPNAANQGALAGVAQAARGALAQMDPDDPSSVSRTIGALQRMGAADQAQGILNLQKSRYTQGQFFEGAKGLSDDAARYAGGQPGAPGAGGAAAPSAPGATPSAGQLDPSVMAQKVNAGRDAIEKLQGITDGDPVLQTGMRRQAFNNEIKPSLIKEGIPEQVIDQWGSNLTDTGLREAHEHFSDLLSSQAYGGDGAGHPPMHPNTEAAMSAMRAGDNRIRLDDPLVQQHLAQIALADPERAKAITAQIEAGQGYTGVVGPNDTVARAGELGGQAPTGPITLAPGQEAHAAGGNLIARAKPLLTPETVQAGATPYAFNPNPNAEGGGQGASGAAPAIPPAGRLGTPEGNATLARLKPLTADQIPSPQGISKALGVPKAEITSDYRTEAKNAAVGGVPDSAHLSGNAYDVAPPKGMTPQQTTTELQRAYPGAYVIPEKGHVHIMWAGAPIPGTPGQGGAPAAAAPQGASGAIPAPGTFSAPLAQGQRLNAPHALPGGAAGGLYQDSFVGHPELISGTGTTPSDVKGSIQGSPQFQRAQASLGAWDTLKGEAKQLNGPATVAALSTLAGLTGAGPEAVIKAYGLPQEWLGKVTGFGGNGPLTPIMMQQVIDAAYPKVIADYKQGAAQVAQGARVAQKNGWDPDLATPPFRNQPDPFFLTPGKDMKPGMTFETKNGRFRVNPPGSPTRYSHVSEAP